MTTISVLDLAPVSADATVGEALEDTVAVAQAAERLGYHRFWVAEHHSMPGIASAAPAVLIGRIAAATESIRVGSGGVMLPNHQPLVVAEQFGTLDAMFPGRVDLGIGRAPGTDQLTAHALRGGNVQEKVEDFPQALAHLRAFFADAFPADHPYAAITATPGIGATPEVWLLGSSTFSAQLAALLGLPFAFARHFAPQQTMPALRTYRENFKPAAQQDDPSLTGTLDAPRAMLTVTVVAAETDEKARRVAAPAKLAMARLRTGSPGRLPTFDEAAAAPLTELQESAVAPSSSAWIVGSRETVRAELAELIERTEADELMVSGMIPGRAERIRSLELIAEAAAA
ncbi:LLM class flavin-dependent oxidoreductase [Tsukamurella sp. 8F]|uniref:LLM class flavin-dependent oxidoreductase n=1 Tax=unclassified Tsukamurella TaxID=2633480 RepID=UPI0023B956A5|nr:MULTISPECIES: LLM class flavin-dependent oxidoreductase [unclassified Tsukamurella]MDF0529182.1 LLM class flavin-dependent oxidoreductase [Tsukamurella sp. 8J]MDF0585367.1 LLM class flavin-dependent oxidoreductase [Tsukamurella sp. 8F]